MATFTDSNHKSYNASEAIGAYIRVKKDTTEVAIAGVADASIGVTVANAAVDELVTVRFKSSTGSAFYKASKAISINAPVYGAADGEVTDAVGGEFIGFAEEAATADGDIIEVLHTGSIVPAPTVGAAQAVSTDEATVVALANSIRTALIAVGIIKGAA